MKKLVFLLTTAFIFSAVAIAQSKVDEVAKFNEEKHDFGKIKQNVPVTYYFEITNTSSKPLVIENASASCGCTVPEYPKEPISPGSTSKIKVQYNAAAMGHFEKDVYIRLAGIADQKTLKITGEVVAANQENNSQSTTTTPSSTTNANNKVAASQKAVTHSNPSSATTKATKPTTTTKTKTGNK